MMEDQMPRFRPNIEAMEAYQPGEQPAAGALVIKLNTNENPYPPSPRVAEAIKKELDAGSAPGERLRLYSDPAALELRRAASEITQFPVEQIICGNGSDELLTMLTRAFVGEGEMIAYPYPTYVLYETLARAQGAEILTCDFDRDFTLPKALFGCPAKLVFLACPGSPSGTSFPASQLEALAKSLPQGVLVIDEAYVGYADADHLQLVRHLPNVVVLRTFSKSHSLAGMRVGLLFGSAEMVTGLWKVKDSYNLDRLAIVAGTAALKDSAWTNRNLEQVCATRGRLIQALQGLGLEVLPSQANFVFVRLGDAKAAAEVYQFLKQRGVLVRYFPARLLDDGIRITVGTDPEIDNFLALFETFLSDRYIEETRARREIP
jgi:histidinol-phosphate aminotransferase